MPSGSEMARRTGWVQPKVSRLETGAQLPTEDDLRTWAQHTGASTEQIEALLDMLSAARVEYTPTADLLTRGALARRQAHLGAMEAAATRIGEYQPAFLPGLVQTPAYTRALLELPGSADLRAHRTRSWRGSSPRGASVRPSFSSQGGVGSSSSVKPRCGRHLALRRSS